MGGSKGMPKRYRGAVPSPLPIPPAPSVPVISVAPVVTGTAQRTQTLTCSTGTWSNSPTSYAFQWRRNGVAIVGATANTLLLTQPDVSATVDCVVTATNAIGPASQASNAVTPIDLAPVNNILPVISGSTVSGSTLSVSNGTWSNNPVSYTYQWRRAGSNIPGATISSYLTVSADVGSTIDCVVTAVNTGGSVPATAVAVGPITSGASAPVNTVLPVISGSLAVGASLFVSNGTWTGSPTSFGYQWKRNGTNIGGATSNTYVTVSGDIGTNISCAVTATNLAGSTTANAAAVGPITSAPSAFPLGINVTDHFRYQDAPFVNLYYGDQIYYNKTAVGLTVLPAANRNSAGWPTSVPGDSTDGYVLTVCRWPIIGDTSAQVTWNGSVDDIQISIGDGTVMTGSGAGGPRTITFAHNVQTQNGYNFTLKWKPTAGNPATNIKITPAGRTGVWNTEYKSHLQSIMATGGHLRSIKWHQLVERNTNDPIASSPFTQFSTRNHQNDGEYWNDDVPLEDICDLLNQIGRNHHYCVALNESDSLITAKLAIIDAWLTANPTLKIAIESGNENWNGGAYFLNSLTLGHIAVQNGLDTGNVAGATVTSATHSSNTVTVTTSSAHGLSNGDRVTLDGFVPWDYNWYPTEAITVLNSTQFSFPAYTVPVSNATTIGTLRKGASAGALGTAKNKAHGLRSSHIMDLVATNISSGNLSRVTRVLGVWNALTQAITDTLAYPGTAGKHDRAAVGMYAGLKYDVYPVDGAYTPSQFDAILADWKIGIDSTMDSTEANRVIAAASGLGIWGYELGTDRQFHGNAPISSITRGGTGNLTATVTTSSPHNLSTGDGVAVGNGVTPSGFAYGDYTNANPGTFASVTVLNSTQFTYTMAADPGGNATVVGAYKTDKVCNLWYESQQVYDGVIYILQEWHSRFGAPANWLAHQASDWAEDLQGRSLYTYFGMPAGIGSGKSAKLQAIQDYVACTVRKPNPLTLSNPIIVNSNQTNGTVLASIRHYVVDSTITVQSVTTGLTSAFSVDPCVTSPSGINIKVADHTAFGSTGSQSITLRETNSAFPSPGYKDTTFTYTVAAAGLLDNFNGGTLDSSKWVTSSTIVNTGQSSTNMTVTQGSGELAIAFGASPSNKSYGIASVNTWDWTTMPSFYWKTTSISGTGYVNGMCFKGSGSIGYWLSRNDGAVALYKTDGTTSVSNLAQQAASIATYPWCRVRFDGTNFLCDVAGTSASNPPAPGDWTNVASWSVNASSNSLPTSGNIGLFFGNFFGATSGENVHFDAVNTGT